MFPNKRVPNIDIFVNKQLNTRVYETKFLGVIIQYNLKWHAHINLIQNKVFKIIGIMSKIKYVLSSPHLRILYQSLIEPCLTYSCIIWLVLKKVLNLRFYINVKNLQLELSMVPSCNYNYVFYCAFFVCFIL